MFDTSGFGLEIGPSYNPLLPKAEGYNVEILDYASAETLRARWVGRPDVDAWRIEEIDYVSDGQSMLELIGQRERYDYIVACHVIEHVTDVVTFLQDCSALLKPAGKLVLAVPDKRMCFDCLKPVSTVGEALQAFIEKRTRHTPGALFDHIAQACSKGTDEIWAAAAVDELRYKHTKMDALELFKDSIETGRYHDVHAWHFTPSSFRSFMKTLNEIGYTDLGEAEFFTPGGHEFHVALSKSAPPCAISYRDLTLRTELELRAITVFGA